MIQMIVVKVHPRVAYRQGELHVTVTIDNTNIVHHVIQQFDPAELTSGFDFLWQEAGVAMKRELAKQFPSPDGLGETKQTNTKQTNTYGS